MSLGATRLDVCGRRWGTRRVARRLCVSLVMVVLLGAASSGSALVTAGATLAAVTPPLPVAQKEFPLALVTRGDRVEVGYGSSLGDMAPPSAIGTLFVRSDRERSFTAVPLKLRKSWRAARPIALPEDEKLWLRALVPDRLLRGRKLLYYAVFRNRRTGRSATVPAAGARAPQTILTVNSAYRIQLGAHVFGHPQTPEAVVARADPTQVGFEGGVLVGTRNGPTSFDVASDGSVWLLDGLNKRVLVWTAGHPDAVARTVPVPFAPADFARGPAGSFYFTRWVPTDRTPDPTTYPPGVCSDSGMHLVRVLASGKPLWERRLGTCIFNVLLRTGPGGHLWWTTPVLDGNGAQRWAPVATPAGRPLSRAEQNRRTLERQPLPGGLQLTQVLTGWGRDTLGNVFPHEARIALVNRAGRVVRAWRIRSRTSIFFPLSATAGLVGADPVIVLETVAFAPPTVPGVQGVRNAEYVALRLGPAGDIRARVILASQDPPLSYWGDHIITDLRIGPGSKLYQLGSSPATGVTINQFSLRRTR